jgi:streptomycin 6-kinase
MRFLSNLAERIPVRQRRAAASVREEARQRRPDRNPRGSELTTEYHAKLFAHELTRQRSMVDAAKLAGALLDAQVDLNSSPSL